MRVAVSALTIAMMTAALGNSASGQVTKPVGPLQILTVTEFLKLSDGLQAVYVGGIIEGMAFVSYGYSIPDYPAWAACVRTKPLGGTTADVVAFIRESPNFSESIASAVAQTIGKRCKH